MKQLEAPNAKKDTNKPTKLEGEWAKTEESRKKELVYVTSVRMHFV